MFMFQGFTKKANEVLNTALDIAGDMGHTYVGSEHMILGILKSGGSLAANALESRGVSYEKVEDMIKDAAPTGDKMMLTLNDFTPRSKRILDMAVSYARRLNHPYVGTEHLLLSILTENDCYGARFIGSITNDIKGIIEELTGRDPADSEDQERSQKGQEKGLDAFTKDLTQMAKDNKLDPVIGRDKEIQRVIQILSRRTKNNPCLIGEPGVGKTAIAEGLAQKIIAGEIPETLKGKRVLCLDLSGMIAGTKYRGDFEERIKNALDEVIKRGDVILFIDELHTLIGAGGAEGAVDAANILKPQLARGELQVIGATTIKEYRKYIEKDAALERRFQPIMVEEPSKEDAEKILFGLRDKYEAHHKIKISDEAIKMAVELSSRYIGDRFLPDKAIDLMDEAASGVRLRSFTAPKDVKDLEDALKGLAAEKAAAINNQDFEQAATLRDREKDIKSQLEDRTQSWKVQNEGDHGIVTGEDIARIVSQWTGVPINQLTEEETDRLRKMEETLKKRVKGQDEAVGEISKAIRRARVGLKNPSRPIGSFIFLGPTGVGKTELCKAVAQTLFGDENNMIRLDMSEYMEKHTVSRLVGSPPGYVGFDDGGQLTEQIRRRPYSVVLFDEIEKAHPDVFNILLQILEDGILTDAQGRRVDFKNAVIIMTSNVGARLITDNRQSSLGFSSADRGEEQNENDIKEKVVSELKKVFRPEFINRVDGIIVFNKLTKDNIKEIAAKMLDEVSIRAKDLEIDLSVDDTAVEKISEIGFDPIYGARPLRRAITSKIEDLLSEEILDGNVSAGKKYLLTVENENFKFIEK